MKGIFWRLNKLRLKSRVPSKLKELIQNENLSRAELDDITFKKLKKVLHYSYNNISFYRKRFDDYGIHPNDINNFEDYSQIPILSKELIQNNYRTMVVKNDSAGVYLNATGGSTGNILHFYQDLEYSEYNEASSIRAYMWSGYQLGDKIALVWGNARDIPDDSFRMRLRSFINRRRYMNAFDIDRKKMNFFSRELSKWKPDIITGYASSLNLLSEYILQEERYKIKPKSIRSTAEVLFESYRDTIEKAFNTKVFDHYGCREVGPIASECATNNNLHIHSDCQYVEILKNNTTAHGGEMGDIIISNLTNFTMPLIRYRIEDVGMMAQKGKCECGLSFPTMNLKIARVTDMIKTSRGKFIHGEFFTHLFYDYPEVKKFQLVQNDYSNFNLFVESEVNSLTKYKDEIIGKISVLMGEKVSVEFKIVKKIPVNSSGKHRFTISKL